MTRGGLLSLSVSGMRGAGSANGPNFSISLRAAWFLACGCNLEQVPTGTGMRRSWDFRGRPLGAAIALNPGTAAAGTAGGARSASQRPCKTARTWTSRRCVRLSRRPLSRGSAAPSGLPLKSRDRRRRMPVGTCSKLQPHARNQAALRLMFGLFAEPSSPHARDRQREQPTWRRDQVRVGLCSVLPWTWGGTQASGCVVRRI